MWWMESICANLALVIECRQLKIVPASNGARQQLPPSSGTGRLDARRLGGSDSKGLNLCINRDGARSL